MDVELEIIEGPDAGLRRTLHGPGEFMAGRATALTRPDLPLHSRDMLASRAHFVMAVGLTECRVRDAGSTNGTWLVGRHGERRVRRERAVPDGSYIRAGGTLLKVRFLRQEAHPASHVRVPVTCDACGTSLLDQALPDDIELAASCLHLCDACAQTQAGNGRGREIGEHLVLSLLGRGRMGTAWRVWQAGTRRVLALKESRAPAAESARSVVLFEREIEVMTSLRHPNLVRLLGHGRDGEILWFVSELQAGGSAEDLLSAAGGRLPAEEAIRIADGALRGLQRMHEAGFVHRDVKPSNVLLSRRHEGIPRLGDFGLAKRFSTAGLSGVTRPGETAGTAGFMAPEQAADFRSATPRADIYGAGATIHMLLSGATPCDPVTGGRAPLEKLCPGLPPRVISVVEKALAPRPRDRWDNARSFREALDEAVLP